MQFFNNLYTYIEEYQRLAYNLYSKLGVPYLVTYHNVDMKNTIWDDKYTMGGAYCTFGELSGIRWNRYLLLPLFFVEAIDLVPEGQEIGYVKDTMTSAVLPGTYGITPYAHDMIKFTKYPVDYPNDSLYQVTGLEHTTGEPNYWKLKLSVEQSKNITMMDPQISNTFVFFDYDKTVHTIDDASFLTKMLLKHEDLRSRLVNKIDKNSGFYFI